jgi:hypothetical protein
MADNHGYGNGSSGSLQKKGHFVFYRMSGYKMFKVSSCNVKVKMKSKLIRRPSSLCYT